MSTARILKVLLLVCVAVSLVACSATPTRRSFKEGWKDSLISTKVEYKLVKDSVVKKRNISIDTWRGIVTMTGRVMSPEEKERAEKLVLSIKGVRGVDNYLKLVDDVNNPEAAKAGVVATKSVNSKSRAIQPDDLLDDFGDVSKKKVVSKTVATKKQPAPVAKKAVEAKVTNKVENDVAFNPEPTPTQSTAKREKYNKPDSSQIKEVDLTSEQSLAKDAAQELKKLRGEDDSAE